MTVTGGAVSANGSTSPDGRSGGAGIGGGSSCRGTAVAVSISGGTVTAAGGSHGAGIGGGHDNDAGPVVVSGGSITAYGGQGAPGVGGGYARPGTSVTIEAGGSLTATGGPGISAIGPGAGRPATAAIFGALSNAGTLVVPIAAILTVPSGAAITNTGTINLHGTLNLLGAGGMAGAGTIHNFGRIFGPVPGGGVGPPGTALLVDIHNYNLTFNRNGGSGTPPTGYRMYAPTLNDAGTSLPPGPPRAGYAFTGWFTAPTGGTQIHNDTHLRTVVGDGPLFQTLYAHFQQNPPPAVSHVSPISGVAQNSTGVTITGSGFTDAIGVYFGSVAAASFNLVSDTTITAVTPQHAAGVVHVRVKTPVATSAAVPADQFTFTPPTVPGPAAVTSSTAGPGRVTVAFTPPDNNGGRPITGYTAQCVSTDGGVSGLQTGTTSPLQVSNLSGGKHYHCRVAAANVVGTGAFGPYGATVLLPAAVSPGSPSVTSSTAGPGRVTVAFTPPANNGGSPITSYTTQCVSTDGGATALKNGTAGPLQVSNLSAEKTYQCRVRAANAVGTGAYSAYGATVRLPAAVVPGPPAVTGSTPSPGTVNVAFSAPVNNGGSPTTSYTAQCVSSDGGVAGLRTGAASPLGVTNLSAGKSYQCRVRATNAVGTGGYGTYGATVDIPPASVPGAPSVTSSTPSVGAVTVTFNPPVNNGGTPITSYTAQCVSTDGGVTKINTGPTSPLQVTNLSAGKSYFCRVRATNAAGTGSYGTYGAKVVIPPA